MSLILEKKIKNKKAKIAVVGLGYVGLPLAAAFAQAGFKVLGLDNNAKRVARVNQKQSYILDVPSRVLGRLIRAGHLKASTDFSLLSNVDVILICVPTPLKRKYTPDISFMLEAVRTIRRFLKRDTLVVLESTTYPGTTEELIQPELEKGGLKVGEYFFLSFSPERIDPGNKQHDLTKIPKIVGGVTPRSRDLTQFLYQTIIKDVHVVSSAKAAEMTKLLENSFRIINIGWINEVAMMCHKMGIDVWEVIDAAKTKPFGFMPFYPGLGVGGHCIPDDPLYLFWKAKHHGFSSKFLKLSADINSHMPSYALARLKGIFKDKTLRNKKILIVGVTYKKDVKDLRKSPALTLIELLQREKCHVHYFDPLIPYLEIGNIHHKSIHLTAAHVVSYDCVVIATDHTRIDYTLILKKAKQIFDIRNVYKDFKDKKIVRL